MTTYTAHLVAAALLSSVTLACGPTVAEDEVAAEVAQDFGVSVHAVYKAKSRVLQRLRTVLQGLA